MEVLTLDHILNHIEVLVVSAHPFKRKGIIGILSSENDIKIVGMASNRLELMECIKLNPDIVIIEDDESVKAINSLEATCLINQKCVDTKVLLLLEDYDENKELTALNLGARGILIESAGEVDLLKCVRAISRGELWVRRKVMDKLIQQLLINQKGRDQSLPMPSFTKRELEIMLLVYKGYKNKEIGSRLFISEKTVKHHLSKIFKKLKVKGRKNIK